MFAAEYDIQCTGLVIAVFFQIMFYNVYYLDELNFCCICWIIVPVEGWNICWECFLLEAEIVGVECGLKGC
jgi:hypothetical protein